MKNNQLGPFPTKNSQKFFQNGLKLALRLWNLARKTNQEKKIIKKGSMNSGKLRETQSFILTQLKLC